MTTGNLPKCKNVILVEGEDGLARAMDHVITADGHACARLAPGDRLADRVSSDRPDLVMVDLTHGDQAEMLDACQSIRRDPALDAVKILMLHSNGGQLEKRRGLALGANGMVALPFRLDELRAEMRRLLRDEEPVH